MNRVTLIGHLGQDPEFRTLQSGQNVCNFSLATSESWKDKTTGEKKEKTEWHKVVVWGFLAEIARAHLETGSKVFVEGKLQTRKWTDGSGTEKYVTEVVLQGFDGKLEFFPAAEHREPTAAFDDEPF